LERGQAVQVGPPVCSGTSRWDEEIGRLLEAAPALPLAARDAVRRVLSSLLVEPGTEAGAVRDIRAVLTALEAGA
jgi:hypothetical protein